MANREGRGRDISGVEEFEDRPARRTIIQWSTCETSTLTNAKAVMGEA